MKIAVLFDRFGPYHVARLRGAMAQAEILAVEGAPHRAVYGWTPPAIPKDLDHVVLTTKAGEESDPRHIEHQLERHVAAHNVDAIALPGWSNLITLVALRWAGRKRIPAVCMSDTNEFDFERKPVQEFLKRRVIAHYSAGLSSNDSQIGYLVKLGLDRASIFRGFDAVDNDFFAAEAERWRVARQLPPEIAESVPFKAFGRYFLASNRFVPKKNLIRLIDAYAEFRQDRSSDPSDWPLVLLGDGPMRSEIEQSISNHCLAQFIHLPGFLQIDSLPQYYGSAGAFVHASTTEQWGLVINEAMASGLPVAVSNRCGAALFLIEDGITGYSFDPMDTSAIARSLARLAALPERSPMIDAAKDRVAQMGIEKFGQGLKSASRAASKNNARPGFTARTSLDLLIAYASRSGRL